MKKLLVVMACLISVAVTQQSAAQVRLNVNVNIGSQPQWGPVGYDYVEYYYLPDIDAYYYVPTRQFIYLSGSNWVFSYSLPPRYRNYNLYNGYKVVINQPDAYRYYNTHHNQYYGYRSNHSQQVIRYSDDPKYMKYKKSKGNNGNRGHGNGQGRGNH